MPRKQSYKSGGQEQSARSTIVGKKSGMGGGDQSLISKFNGFKKKYKAPKNKNMTIGTELNENTVYF